MPFLVKFELSTGDSLAAGNHGIMRPMSGFTREQARLGGKTVAKLKGREYMSRIGRRGRKMQLADMAKKIRRCPKCKQVLN